MVRELLIAALAVISLTAAAWFVLFLDAQPNGELRNPVKITGTIVEIGTAASFGSQAKSPNDVAIEVRLANGTTKDIRTSLLELSNCGIGSSISLEQIGQSYRVSDKACSAPSSDQ